MSKANIFIAFCLSFIAGIFLDSLGKIPLIVSGIFLILGIALISIFWPKDKRLIVIGFCFLLLVVGFSRHQIVVSKIEKNELQFFNDQKEKIFLTGTVIAEPDIRPDKVQLNIGHIQLHYENGSHRIRGKILVTTDKYAGHQYGDRLELFGQLKTPAVFEDFNYQDYLAKDGIYSVMYWPKIELIEKNKGSPLYAKILSFKDKIRTNIHRFLKPPQSIILGAIMLGDKKIISDELKEKLNMTGLRHITAISGMHITILSAILIQLLIGFGLWRGQAFYLAIVFLVFFILMIGAPVSAVRAGIMGGLLMLAEKVGRLNQAWRGLIFVAALMLALNPLLLKLDVGFQLSFLAALGIICFTPFFIKLFKFLPDFLKIRQAGAMTLSAQLFVLPILIYNFGQISLVAPLTNVLVVPLVAYILMTGFFGGLLGLLFPFLGTIIFLPAWLLLSYIVKVIDWFSALPFSALVFKEVHWAWMIIYYLIILFLSRHIKRPEHAVVSGRLKEPRA